KFFIRHRERRVHPSKSIDHSPRECRGALKGACCSSQTTLRREDSYTFGPSIGVAVYPSRFGQAKLVQTEDESHLGSLASVVESVPACGAYGYPLARNRNLCTASTLQSTGCSPSSRDISVHHFLPY